MSVLHQKVRLENSLCLNGHLTRAQSGRCGRNLGRVEGGFLVGAMLIKQSAFEAVGRFEEDRMLGDFIDWFARAQDAGLKLPVLDELVLRRRIHGRNTVIRELSSRGDYAKTLKTILDRRRASAQAKSVLPQERERSS